MKRIRAGVLDVAYREAGPPDGAPVILLHGFPYDVHAYDAVCARLAALGTRCLVPYLRGYGPTRFLDAATPRSGQQAALGTDLVAFMDALAIPRAVLGGDDWGGRAACIAAALRPERASGLVSAGVGYNIQDLAAGETPVAPEAEHRLWYQHYFRTERGRAGLADHRDDLCRLLWRLWSPTWTFEPATFARSAAAFDNPDFVAVVIHSYRHRFGGVPGDPALDAVEARLAAKPPIPVPTRVLPGADDGVSPPTPEDREASRFTGPYERRILPGVGHNVPQEAPGRVQCRGPRARAVSGGMRAARPPTSGWRLSLNRDPDRSAACQGSRAVPPDFRPGRDRPPPAIVRGTKFLYDPSLSQGAAPFRHRARRAARVSPPGR